MAMKVRKRPSPLSCNQPSRGYTVDSVANFGLLHPCALQPKGPVDERRAPEASTSSNQMYCEEPPPSTLSLTRKMTTELARQRLP